MFIHPCKLKVLKPVLQNGRLTHILAVLMDMDFEYVITLIMTSQSFDTNSSYRGVRRKRPFAEIDSSPRKLRPIPNEQPGLRHGSIFARSGCRHLATNSTVHRCRLVMLCDGTMPSADAEVASVALS